MLVTNRAPRVSRISRTGISRVNRALTVLGLALAVGAGACKSLGLGAHGKGEVSPPLAGFDTIDVSGGLIVDITVGGAFAVAIDGDETLARLVDARVEKQTLVLAPRGKADAHAKEGAHVRVTLPELRRLEVDASRVAVSGAGGPKLQIIARAGSTVNVAALEGSHLRLEATQGSRLVLAGAADTIDIALAGASRGDGRQLKVRTAKVDLAGASRLDLCPEQGVSGEAKGASKLAVWSSPKRMKVATRGASSVTYVR
jgi:hypothetical protein